MAKVKVLHVYRTYFPETQGGVEEVIRQICLNTASQDVKSRVFTLKKGDGPKVIRRREATVYRADMAFELASCGVAMPQEFAAFRRQAAWADVIHYHFPWPFADVLYGICGLNKPSVVTYHSDIVRQQALLKVYTPIMSRFLGSVDRIIATSENYFATSSVLSRFSYKVDIVPIGINEGTYEAAQPEELERVRQCYGEGFFLFVGVLRYYKGLHILLDAIKGAPYKVIIAGSGPTEMELKKQAKELELTNVVFTGYVPNKTKAALFHLSRAAVFPSYLRSEAFGVTLLEGAMHAKPLISCEVGSGTSHVNEHEKTGLVIPPGSSKLLRQAMDYLYYHPDIARQMGQNAKSRFKKLFCGDLMGERYVNIYQSVLGQYSREPVYLS